MKLGCLPYLNVRPLVYTLEKGGLPRGWEFVYAPPSVLAGMLVRGEIAAAPVSSFACFANPSFGVCPGICIAADGPVRSVLLLSKVPIDSIRTIALDTSSLSGANMLRIILSEGYDLTPEFVRADPQPARMLEQADAALVIGDPAMVYPKDGLYVLDLAEQWRKLTGLPAVFAVWAGGGMTAELVEILRDAKRQGMAMLPEIAREESERLGLPYEVCYEYLSEIMVYDMGEREKQGFDVFREKAASHGLLEAGK
jgi:chorismate dehydratase